MPSTPTKNIERYQVLMYRFDDCEMTVFFLDFRVLSVWRNCRCHTAHGPMTRLISRISLRWSNSLRRCHRMRTRGVIFLPIFLRNSRAEVSSWMHERVTRNRSRTANVSVLRTQNDAIRQPKENRKSAIPNNNTPETTRKLQVAANAPSAFVVLCCAQTQRHNYCLFI